MKNIVRIEKIELQCRNLNEVTGFGVSFDTDEAAYNWLADITEQGKIDVYGEVVEVEAIVKFDNGGKLAFKPFDNDFMAVEGFENPIGIAILERLKEPTIHYSKVAINNYILCLEAFVYGLKGWVRSGEDDVELHKEAIKRYDLLGKIDRASELLVRVNSARLDEISLIDEPFEHIIKSISVCRIGGKDENTKQFRNFNDAEVFTRKILEAKEEGYFKVGIDWDDGFSHSITLKDDDFLMDGENLNSLVDAFASRLGINIIKSDKLINAKTKASCFDVERAESQIEAAKEGREPFAKNSNYYSAVEIAKSAIGTVMLAKFTNEAKHYRVKEGEIQLNNVVYVKKAFNVIEEHFNYDREPIQIKQNHMTACYVISPEDYEKYVHPYK